MKTRKPTPAHGAFSIGEARGIVRDLFEPNPQLYWIDFLASMVIGAAAFVAIRRLNLSWPLMAVAFVVSVLAFYRATLFTHELTHLRQGRFRGFRLAWNLLCGIPFLMPSFMYHTHVAHHMRRHFGTHNDGEYLPWGAQPIWHLFMYLGQCLVMPLIAVVRFGLLTPLCWLSPKVREIVQRRFSSLVVDPYYVRPLPTRNDRWIWRVQEGACFALVWGNAAAMVFNLVPRPVELLIQGYLTAATSMLINQVRTLGAHRYTNPGGEMTFVQQMLDSVNYPGGSWLRALWAPVGLRYHALHHLFPSMPYHRLGEAHRRLMEQLPADHPYRLTNCPSLWLALTELWASARASSRAQRSPARPHYAGVALQRRAG